jgi:hypothetical protein
LGRALAKPHPRVVGVDDGPFRRGDRQAPVALVVCSLPDRVDGVVATTVTVDGTDATERIARAIEASGHLDGIRAVLLDGITFGGFNVVDLTGLAERLRRPVLAVTRRPPDFARIDAACVWTTNAGCFGSPSRGVGWRSRSPGRPAPTPRSWSAARCARADGRNPSVSPGSWPGPALVDQTIKPGTAMESQGL